MSDISNVCRDFIRGACTRGSRCRFLHSDDVLATSCTVINALPSTGSRKRKVQNECSDDRAVRYCLDFQRGQCRRAPGCCRYVHEFSCHEDQQILGDGFSVEMNFRSSEAVAVNETDTCHSVNNQACGLNSNANHHDSANPNANWNTDDNKEGDVPSTSDSLRLSARRAPVCRDYLKGVCHRSALCKYRHMSLDQYTTELLDHTKTSSCCCGSLLKVNNVVEDRLKLIEAENSSLRKRVTMLNNQLKQLLG